MRAGNLDRRVAILRRTLTHDGLQQVETWQLLGTRSASRKALPGGEREEGERRRSFARYSLWLRIDGLTRQITSADAIGMLGERFELLQPPIPIDRPREHAIELLVESTGEAWAP
jgi:head-tail adaptor